MYRSLANQRYERKALATLPEGLVKARERARSSRGSMPRPASGASIHEGKESKSSCRWAGRDAREGRTRSRDSRLGEQFAQHRLELHARCGTKRLTTQARRSRTTESPPPRSEIPIAKSLFAVEDSFGSLSAPSRMQTIVTSLPVSEPLLTP